LAPDIKELLSLIAQQSEYVVLLRSRDWVSLPVRPHARLDEARTGMQHVRTVFIDVRLSAPVSDRDPFSVPVHHLFRDDVFPAGWLPMSGTGRVRPGRFRLRRGDEVRITIEPIGTLVSKRG
jgi:hypothetical protein